MFEFMRNAFFALVGIICISLAAIILAAVINGIIGMYKRSKERGRS